jgi:O-succinylbenzoate synthase
MLNSASSDPTSPPITIDRITAYLVKIPLVRPFRISVGQVTEKEFVVFEGRSGDTVGWGEAAVDGIPFYTSETAETALHIGRRVLAPLIKSRAWSSPQELVKAMDAYRGHAFTKAAFDAMFWDIYGQKKNVPVWQLLEEGQTGFRQWREWIEGGPSIGIKDTPEQLVETVAQELERGFRRIKIKVAPGKDIPYIEAVRTAYPDITLMVDANSAYTPHDLEHLSSWDAFDLLMIEQPLDQHDLYYHAQLCHRMETPLCLDESIETVHLARCGVDMHAMDIVNIKVGRVGGLVRAREVHNICRAAGIPVWIGSRLGSGIATAMRLAAATLPNATYPSDIGFGRQYLADDLIEGWFETRNGCEIRVPSGPGLGITIDRQKLQTYTLHQEEL